MSDEIKQMVEESVKTKIIQAFKDAPEAIDAIVAAALEQPVNEWGGKPEGYNRNTLPYLDWLVGDTIRGVAREAVVEAVNERKDEIRAAIEKNIKAEGIVDAMLKTVIGTMDTDYKLSIVFADGSKG